MYRQFEVINTLIVSNIAGKGEEYLQDKIDGYFVSSIRTIRVMKGMFERNEYERLAAEATKLGVLAAGLGVNRVLALCATIGVQCTANSIQDHERQEIECNIQILERQNYEGHGALLQLLDHLTLN
ncbi:hypothetical protein PCANC_13804 [Puccinia coronata f. sp. avenae]|uniref:Uncharacterized protein n=1 Tax=Puccinia coronata f. sp. avenae TaxID=200324 RepID=A0A2N5SJJ7_9BASI|nr:hypothetical protein PCANC_21177 [Puccinia coronata f. sp. avenae]PLW13384.1 hypothetical protein PCASD_19188 [Puccinia coronata f. sp. avenae]PLW36608.1 hypothetical protein PCASD_11363 [Puccinia coronata f. sp. avenae]PLW44117.1 hypothetical protein PCANC_13804 [Puccinia coronata f. sp. avenae]